MPPPPGSGEPPWDPSGETWQVIPNGSGIPLDSGNQGNFPKDWNEIDGYNEHWAADDNAIVRFFRGPWATSGFFHAYMVGSGANKDGVLSRAIPHQHPIYPWLYCTEVDFPKGEGAIINDPGIFSPDGNPLPIITYIDSGSGSDKLSCIAKATYRGLDYEIRTDAEMKANNLSEINRWVMRDTTFAAQALPLPWGKLLYTSGPLAGKAIPDNAAFLFLPTREVTYTWLSVPDVPWDAIDACQGMLNSRPFDPLVKVGNVNVGGYRLSGYAPGTLYMLPPDVKRHRSPYGDVAFHIVYKFLYRPQGHNNFPDTSAPFPGTQAPNFILCTHDGSLTGRPLYGSADFTDPKTGIFTQPNPAVNYQGPGGGGVPPG